MELRPLGSTGLTVSRIGLGLAALGRPAYINLGRDADLGSERSVPAMEQRCHEMLDAAVTAGICYVDTARSYGLAEQFLGSWLRERRIAPGAITIGSKWGYTYTAGWQAGAQVNEVKDLSLQTLLRQIRESREALGGHLQLYQIHSATIESGVLDDAQVLSALTRLRSEGLAIGLTVTGPKQGDVIRRALEASADGVNPFQVVQATWNLLEPSAGSALSDAKAAGWGVIVKEALANGRLTDRQALSDSPILRSAKVLGLPVDSLVIATALSQPWADVVLSGAVTPQQLQSNLSALDVHISADALPSIALPAQEYWSERSKLRWE